MKETPKKNGASQIPKEGFQPEKLIFLWAFFLQFSAESSKVYQRKDNRSKLDTTTGHILASQHNLHLPTQSRGRDTFFQTQSLGRQVYDQWPNYFKGGKKPSRVLVLPFSCVFLRLLTVPQPHRPESSAPCRSPCHGQRPSRSRRDEGNVRGHVFSTAW